MSHYVLIMRRVRSNTTAGWRSGKEHRLRRNSTALIKKIDKSVNYYGVLQVKMHVGHMVNLFLYCANRKTIFFINAVKCRY